MARTFPVYCPHDKMIDGGDFVEEDELDGCEPCKIPPPKPSTKNNDN